MSEISWTEEQFQEEMDIRRERLGLAEGEAVLGCPLCGFTEYPAAGVLAASTGQDQ